MKRCELRRALPCFVLASALSIGAAGCLVCAFSLTASLPQIAALGLLSAALGLLCTRRYTAPLALLPAVLCACLSWNGLEQQLEALLWTISRAANDTFHTGYLFWWTKDDHTGCDVTALLSLLAALLAVVAARGLRRGKTGGVLALDLAALLPSLLLGAPAPLWQLLHAAALCAVLLTRAQDKDCHAPRRPAVQARAMVAAVLLVCLLAGLMPPSQVEPADQPALKTLLQQLRDVLHPPAIGSDDPSSGEAGFVPNEVRLDNVGEKSRSPATVFTVSCKQTADIYLRQMSYTVYTGLRWQTVELTEDFSADSRYLGEDTLTMELNFRTIQTSQMIPYYHAAQLINGSVPNASVFGSRSYVMSYTPARDDLIALWRENVGGTPAQQSWDEVSELYLQLPDSTMAAASALLRETVGITDAMDIPETAQRIADYVRGSAKYDLKTSKLPAGRDDFALWFLGESQSGYCVHFATAATVLLRAAGIPARYVRGYLFRADADYEVKVLASDAHAWTEYYLPGFGWVVLEATPSSNEPDATDPTDPTDPTEPPATDPTVPIAPTAPSETHPAPTKPAPTTPTAPTAPSPAQTKLEIPAFVWTSLYLALLAALLLLQSRARVRLRARRMAAQAPNARALSYWRYARRLSRALRREPPLSLHALASKARFSQHTLTQAELREFEQYHADCIAQLRERGLLCRLFDRVAAALY